MAAMILACHGSPEARMPLRDAGAGAASGSGGSVAMTGGLGGTSNPYRFDFELDEQYWKDLTREPFAGLAPVRSADRAFEGRWSLKYRIETSGTRVDAGVTSDGGAAAADDTRVVGVVGSDIGPLPPGQTFVLRLWVPPNHGLRFVQAFMQTRMAGSWVDDTRASAALQGEAWNEFRLPVPEGYADADPLEFGFFLVTDGAWQGDVYVDGVELDAFD